jgi:hypothetical protein
MNGQRAGRMIVMAAGWVAVGAVLGYAFGLRRFDLLAACGLVALAAFVAVSGIAFLLSRYR